MNPDWVYALANIESLAKILISRSCGCLRIFAIFLELKLVIEEIDIFKKLN